MVSVKYLEHSSRGTKPENSCQDLASSGMFPVLLCLMCPNLKQGTDSNYFELISVQY